jgi:hypothetical protein
LHFKALFVEATQSVLQTLQSKSSPWSLQKANSSILH